MHYLRFITVAADRMAWGLGGLGKVAIVAMLILVAGDVFYRYALNSPLLFGEEVAGYLAAAVGFLGAAETLRQRRHVRIEFLLNAVSGKWRGWLDVATHLIGVIALVVFFWHSSVFFDRVFTRGTVAPSILATPLWIPQTTMLIGMTAFLFQLVVDTAHAIGRALGRNIDRPQL